MCPGHKKRARSLRVLRAAQRSSPRAGRSLDQNRRVGKGSAGFLLIIPTLAASRLGRNDEVKALAPSNTSSFPRRFFAPGFCILASLTRIYGVAERRESSGACEAPVGPARNAAGQAPNEAPCVPYGGRPRPGALTVAILG